MLVSLCRRIRAPWVAQRGLDIAGLAVLLVVVVAPLLGVLALPLATASAQPMMTEAKWQRFETENFVVLYPKGYEATAGHCAMLAEEAYRHLSPLFRWDPSRRITLIINDGNDRHNGYATIFPRPTIQLELHPPDTRQTIYAADYLRQVIVHELAHIMQLDQTDRLRGTARNIFGTVLPASGDPLSLAVALLTLPPNATAPTWFLEGGAQWAETEFGYRGRGQSPLHSAYLRALVLDGRIPAVDEAVLASPDWPFGNAAYLWGLAVMRHWQIAHGGEGQEVAVPAELTHRYASGIPGWFEPATQELLGEWANRAWESGTRAIVAEQEGIAAEIRQAGPVTTEHRLTPEGLVAFNPLPSRDGRTIYFVGNPQDRPTAMYRLDRHTGTVERLPVRLSTSSRIWHMPGAPEWLLFTRLEPRGTDQWRVVLYRVRTDGTQLRRITQGRFTESAPEPSMPNHLWTVEPLTDRGEPHARLILRGDLPLLPRRYEASAQRLLEELPPPPYVVPSADPAAATFTLAGIMHSPTPLGDGRVAVVHEHEETARILLFGLPADEVVDEDAAAVERHGRGHYRVLHHQTSEIRDLRYDSARARLLFVSGSQGVLNLYALPLSSHIHAGRDHDAALTSGAPALQPPQRLTNALVGYMEAVPLDARNPQVNAVIAVALDAHGPHLVRLDANELVARHNEPLPELLPQWPFLGGYEPALGPEPADLHAFGTPEPTNHGLLAGLTFQHWHPFLGISGNDFVAAGATVHFGDPLLRTAFEASAGYNWSRERPFGALRFSVQPDEPTFTFASSFTTLRFADRFELAPDGPALDYHEDLARFTAGLSVPLRELDITWRFGLTFELEWRGDVASLNDAPATAETLSLAPFRGWRAGVLGSLSVSSLSRYPRSIGPEDGISATLRTHYRPAILAQHENWLGASLAGGAILAIPGGSHQLEIRGALGVSSERHALQDGFPLGGHAGIFALRGYPFAEQLGRFALTVGLAYRFPLIEIYRGLATVPLYVRMLALELYAEAGTAFDHGIRNLRSDQLLTSLGAELQLKLSPAGTRVANFDLTVGYVYAAERTPTSERHNIYLRFGLPLP